MNDPTFCDVRCHVRRSGVQRFVDPHAIVVFLKITKLPPQIMGVPERYAIEEFPPDRADQSFNERMR